MSSIINQSPYLRTTREYPEDNIHMLALELNKSYIDIANCVNNRTIGLFPTTRPAITGNSYFLTANQRQQTLRQVYTFTATTAIAHGITNVVPGQFIECFGSYTDGTSSFGLFFGTSTAIAGQITFYVTSTQIVFSVGAGAPALSSGRIVLQWLSNP